ncbi:hypothetical protein D3C86_1009930 [compost metagenome]
MFLKRLPKEIGEKRVIAEPLALIVRGDDEQVAALQIFDHRFAVAAIADGIAQGRTELFQHAGLQQELAAWLALPREHVFGEVFRQRNVGAAERGNECGRIAMPLQGQRGQINTGNPAFGALMQTGDFWCGEGQLTLFPQVAGRLIEAQAQCFGADFQQLAAGA